MLAEQVREWTEEWVEEGREQGIAQGQLQLFQGDAADGGLHAEALGQLPGHVEPGAVTRPDAVVQPVRRRRPQQRARGRGDVVDMARRHDPVDERPDLAPIEQRAGDRRRRARPRHRPPELSARAGDQHPHRERSFTIARVSRSMLAKVSMSARQPRRRTRA